MPEELNLMLTERTKTDGIYQQLLEECKKAEAEYIKLTASYSEGERQILERYISACDELEYRRTYIALTMKK